MRASGRRIGRLRVVVLAVAVGLGFQVRGTAVQAQAESIRGLVVDSATGRPVADAVVMLAGTSHTTLTDDRGQFAIEGVRAGLYRMRVSHLAYGERTVEVQVEAGGTTAVRLSLSAEAIALEPISVEVLTGWTQVDRAAGARRSIVTREQIALAQNTNLTLADVLKQYVPGVRVRSQESRVGTPICVELRTIRAMGEGCLSPAVYLDGVPVMNPSTLYGTLDPQVIETMEVVGAAEAGARYGSGALYGALLIETRRPGGARAVRRVRPLPAFDWDLDDRTHPGGRAFLYSFIGNAVGLTLGLVTANQCIMLRRPAEDSIVTRCETWPTVGSAVAAVTLPALGGAIGARLGGSTELSRGKLLPAGAGAVMALLPGYALAISSDRENSVTLGVIAGSILTVGVPFAATLADRLFRSLRGGPRE